MYPPIIKTNQPNPFFNWSPLTLDDIFCPIKIPPTANNVNGIRSFQSIVIVLILPKNPKNEFIDIIANEVPTATFILRLLSFVNAGIIIKPPPAPTIPVKHPIHKPLTKFSARLFLFIITSLNSVLPLIIINADPIMITENNTNIKMRFVNSKSPIKKRDSGISGTKNFLVKKIEIMVGIPNNNAVLKLTCCFRDFIIVPIKLADPTTKSEYAGAVTAASTPIKYTNIGIAKIEPPAPIKPEEMPTKTANM